MSLEDRLRAAAQKSLESLDFGVGNIWVIDPNPRVVYRGTETGLERVPSGMLAVAGTPIEISVTHFFEKLDSIWSGSGA